MIPILLDNTKTLPELVASQTGGIGDITGAFDGVAVEEANGLKELSFKLPVDSPRYSQVKVGSYIKAKVDEYHDPQIYEVYKITKPLKGIVTIKAQHISYILGKATVKPFTATGIIQVTQQMISRLIGTFPFAFQTDIVNTTNQFNLDVPMSFRKAIGGWRGSVLDVFGGELDWDNLDVKLLAHRGRDRGVRVEYGKNLTDLTQEESIANVYDAVLGYAVVNDVTYVGEEQKITTTNSPRILNIDFSSAFNTDETPTVGRLNQLARAYAENNDIGKPSVNLKVSFEPLSRFEEYEDIALLEQTGLFDTIYVLFPKLGVESKAKIIRTEYDFINEKMISVELGDAKTNLLGLMDEQIESQVSEMDLDIDVTQIENAVGMLDSYIDSFSEILSNSLGLFFTRVERTGGSYQYYLHNKPLLANSQYQWTINAGGFAVSQDYGQTWTAGIDAQGNAIFNSLSANVVRALQIYGSYIQGSQIVFGDLTDKYIIAQPYSENDVPQGVSFDGTGFVRFQPQESFIVNNTNSNGDVLNQFLMSTENANTIYLYNYYYNDVSLLANQLKLSSNAQSNGISMMNYKRSSPSAYANYFYLSSNSTNATICLENHVYDTDLYANQIILRSNSMMGNRIEIVNYMANGYGATASNSLIMRSDSVTTLWSSDDLRLRSTGAVRVYADLYQSTTIGDWNNNRAGTQQDLYLGGYSVKIQADFNGRIYLYWGSTRYYLGVSNGLVTATLA